jgi:hypothetical protein
MLHGRWGCYAPEMAKLQIAAMLTSSNLFSATLAYDLENRCIAFLSSQRCRTAGVAAMILVIISFWPRPF